MVKQKGIRDGIDKKEIMKSMNDGDWKRLKLQKEVEECFVDDADARECAVRSDQMYLQFNKILSDIEGSVFNMLSAKTKQEKNKRDIIKQDTNRFYPGTQEKMSIRDLEIENMHIMRLIGDNRRNLWVLLANAYRYTNLQRIDKKVFFTKEDFKKLVGKVKDELGKNSILLFEGG